MVQSVQFGNRLIGSAHPTYIVGEIGINHNGSLENAKKLIDAAALAGCVAVKFQKRTPEVCVPAEQRDVIRETPWGTMTYLEYRYRVEFDADQYREIDRYCREKGLDWFASCWDAPSVDFMEQFDPPGYKIASASLTDTELLDKHVKTGRPLIVSTGMSTLEEISDAVERVHPGKLVITHTTSTYPCPAEELNLRVIPALQERYGCPIGYSGHEAGLTPTYAAVTLGARLVERHITLDRAMWGSDQAASVEPWGLARLVRDIRVVASALGDGMKRVYRSETLMREKLRRA
jgi:N-acetylneuraminate synthase